MERMPVPSRIAAFTGSGCPQPASCGITRRFHRLSRRTGWVAYALRTRAPLSRRPKAPIPFDLHVLGLPLAFILSQDQTLHRIVDLLIFLFSGLLCSKKTSQPPDARLPPHRARRPSCLLLLASDFQRTAPNIHAASASPRVWDCKNTTFIRTLHTQRALFFGKFVKNIATN